jgi:indole-3-glycerol phosphate synthase
MSVSKVSKRRGTILDEIMAYQRQQLPKLMRDVPLEDVRALASVAPPPADLIDAVARPGLSLIAECKRASPSKGLLVSDYDPVKLASRYVRAEASAISVLTNNRYFQGSLADLRDVKNSLLERGGRVASIPVLRKDFIFHPYQCFEARAAGADAVLLIAAILAKSELAELMAVIEDLGMVALVEIHTRSELDQVLTLQPRLVGINNRDLQTFKVDFDNTARLRRAIPEDVLVVAESGIRHVKDVRRLAEVGVDAILVGEALVRSNNVSRDARKLVVAGKNI